ncbi:LytR/AlgR family response regulator transcription factor [Sinomicrobium soli]|uniref:LytR/AlgR family response regulator transcription factor n=1 Tax=Sinomicrobium sp. N-1-3-6 TaxID=2219864 RepID=UPI000DCCA6BD|nr:LytTR family DNA-binding domain-containing protein [Sinomicrobium sp. N-1-3-6]RAV27472.1 DNA-binding response regulator [Sinomicrobium sp. N-1-3-6]
MQELRCVITDDEEVDRLMVTSFVKRFPILDLKGVFEKAGDTLAYLETHPVDVLFLDIDMPGENGLELRKKAQQIPVCIFITAHPEYAVDSFQLDTLDFIVKPLKFERFASAIERIEKYMGIYKKASLYEASLGGDVIYIKEGHDQVKVQLHEILYLEALKDYTLLITPKKRHCVASNLGTLLNTEHFASFVRVHRSFAVQKQRVSKVSAHEVEMDNAASVPIGRSFKENLTFLL